jgi:hypothetical protein
MRRLLPVVLLLPWLAAPPARAGEEPSVQAVHRAIRAGADWLKQQHGGDFETRTWHEPVELVVLTLSHAGVPLSDPVLAKGLATIETVPLQFTYRVSVLAMALERINSRKYRERLAHCAQWLVDTQLAAGEWGYPGSIRGPDQQPGAVSVPEPTRAEGAEADAPIVIERKIDVALYGGAKGDFSNTQFAVLGLRACRDAGIEIPRATWQAAYDYMRKTQRADGGWGYVYFGEQDDASYASLTCAGLSGAAICLHALKKGPAKDAVVKKARAWLDEHFDATRNVGIDRSAILGPSSWETYHLYSVERVGSILGWKEIGGRAWYPEGARHLLATQRGDGSWLAGGGAETFGARPRYLTTADTCFALLFLSKATPPLTGGR